MSNDWESSTHHISVREAFDGVSDPEPDEDGEDAQSLFSGMELLSPTGHTDAQTLALMLQEQLDAINTEIR